MSDPMKKFIWVRVPEKHSPESFTPPGLGLEPALVMTAGEYRYAYYRLTADTSWKKRERAMILLSGIFGGDPAVIKKRFKHPSLALRSLKDSS